MAAPWLLPTLLLAATMLTALAAAAAGTSKEAEVIVVGAGLAGLKAAADLAAKGTSVIVLEARSRVGGRVWSTPVTAGGKQAYAELGAGWVHGVNKNAAKDLAAAAGVSLSGLVNYDNSRLFRANGQVVDDATESRYDAMFDPKFDDYFVSQQDKYDGVSDPGLSSVVNQFIKSKGYTGNDLLAFKYELNVNIEHEYSGSISQLSLFYDYDSPNAGGDVFVTGGYQNLAAYLASGLDVRLSTQVVKIDTSSASAIKIATASGDVFTATKAAVCAVPLGVLKAGAITFTPALPSSNTNAIAKLGVGLLNKVVLAFPRVFWPSNLEFINRISTNGDGAWQEFTCANKPTGAPILVAFNAADYAKTLEAKSDNQTVSEVMGVLRTLFGASTPSPTSAIVTRWAADPFARGSYSFLAKGALPADRTKAAAPAAGNRLFFAGEHTRTDYPATTHGALLSGKDAACSVLKALGKACPP